MYSSNEAWSPFNLNIYLEVNDDNHRNSIMVMQLQAFFSQDFDRYFTLGTSTLLIQQSTVTITVAISLAPHITVSRQKCKQAREDNLNNFVFLICTTPLQRLDPMGTTSLGHLPPSLYSPIEGTPSQGTCSLEIGSNPRRRHVVFSIELYAGAPCTPTSP